MEPGSFTTSENGDRVLTSRHVMYESWPILLVVHLADERGSSRQWNFVNGWGDTDEASNAMTVHVHHLTELDSTIESLADLPPGWRAWRATPSDPWNREPTPPDGEG